MIVFGYNFPHWKTQNGLINMVANGIIPDMVILQDKKQLNLPHSDYRITPKGEYLQEPKDICNMLGLNYDITDHDNSPFGDLGVILGSRILKKEVIERFSKGILNMHPGILPGNRGLDNLKHSITKRLPVGVTAHLIDHRIDMGLIIDTKIVPIYSDDTIRDVYIRQRNTEQELMINVLKREQWDLIPCIESEKFTVITEAEDFNIHHNFSTYKKYFN